MMPFIDSYDFDCEVFKDDGGGPPASKVFSNVFDGSFG